ncbi:hypothetical protein [Streptomyces sp. JNUCC 63]
MSLRRSLLALRMATSLRSVLLIAQVAPVGGFLGGHVDMLKMHGGPARGIVAVALLMAVAAFLVSRAGRPRSSAPRSY